MNSADKLGHLLILTDQTRLMFMRTHAPEERKTPEEALVDVIAGSLAFYPAIVRAHARGEISFEAIEAMRSAVWPEASVQSALLGISKAWPTPCILLEARLAYKATENPTNQQSFAFRKQPKPALRAVHVSPNDAARNLGMKAIPNFRVPLTSVIYRVFRDSLPYAEATEELSSWTSSEGTCWEGGQVLVKAKLFGDAVQALLIP